MGDMLQFKKGLRAALPTAMKAGTIYVTTDERAMYVDVSDTQRIRLGDFIEYATMAEFQAAGHYSTTALYYIAEGSKLLKYSKTETDGTISFVHLNSVQGVSEEIGSLQNDVKALDTAIKSLQNNSATTEALNTVKGELNAAIALKADNTALTKEADRAKAAEKTLQDNIDDVDDKADANALAIEEIKQNYATDVELANAQSAINDAIALKANTSTVTAMDAAYKKADTDINARIDDVVEDIGEINTALDGLGSTYATKTELSNAQTTLNTAIGKKADQTALTSEVNRSKEVEEALGVRIDGVVETVDGHTTAITNLTNNSATKTQLETAKSELNTAIGKKADQTALTSEVNRSKAAEKALGERIDGVVEDIGEIETAVNNNKTAHEKNAKDLSDYKTSVASTYVTLSAYNTKMKALDDKDTAHDGDISSLKNRANALETTVGQHTTAINNHQTSINDHEGRIDALEQADIDLRDYIDGQFDAANAMRFMGETTSLAKLKDGSALNAASKPAQAGDTYVLTATDTTSTPGTTYAIGDLFIAKVDGDNTQWTHVASGYVQEHEARLSGASNKLSLRSYTGANLGDISVVAAANSAITASVANNTLTIGMEWGSF